MKSFAIALAFSFIFAVSAEAGSSWTVQRSSGQVAIAGSGAQTISLGGKSDLPNGATITTGASGRVLLVRGKEIMSVGPNSVVMIPGDNLFGFTTILQKAGEVTFDVEKRNVRHFAVNTPFLAAVVKGTRFTVRVSRKGASVSVTRGLVGVTNLSTGQRNDVGAGQLATVSGSNTTLSGKGVQQTAALNDGPGDSGLGSSEKGKKEEETKSGSSGNGGNGNSGNGNGHGNSGHGGGDDDDDD
jgi:hypothetical protein